MGAETQRKSFPPSTEVELVSLSVTTRYRISAAAPTAVCLCPEAPVPRRSGAINSVRLVPRLDSRLVAAGGTLANLAAGMVFWIALRSTRSSSVRLRFFLLISLAFNLFGHWTFLLFWDHQFRRLGGVESTPRKTAMRLAERKENS